MDSLSYSYLEGKNQLSFVNDDIADDYYDNDINDQDSFNYEYDVIGNLISDAAENIDPALASLIPKTFGEETCEGNNRSL